LISLLAQQLCYAPEHVAFALIVISDALSSTEHRLAAGQASWPRAPPQTSERLGTLRRVKAFRRLLFVLGIAALIGFVARLRGKGGVPPTSGGWRELEGPDFR
jgi:hypothetical protein